VEGIISSRVPRRQTSEARQHGKRQRSHERLAAQQKAAQRLFHSVRFDLASSRPILASMTSGRFFR